jgi:hypothetical protein
MGKRCIGADCEPPATLSALLFDVDPRHPVESLFLHPAIAALGAGQTHFLYTGYFHPNGASEAEVQDSLRDFYHAVFAGIGRVLNVNFTIQQ